jgi:bifunctional non-homologous end joining protein LigD
MGTVQFGDKVDVRRRWHGLPMVIPVISPTMWNAYRPCLPTSVMKAPSGERWVHEIKHDGFRIIARRVDRNVRLFTKHAADYSRRYPLVVEAINRLRVTSIVLDGEAVCVGSDGFPDFDALWNRTNDAGVLFFPFDLLELNGDDFRSKPLAERKQRLAKLLSKDRTGLRYVKHLDGDGPTIFDHSCKLGLEGIVSKRIDLPYEAGRSKSWQKIKNKDHPAMQRVREAFERERLGQRR